MNINNINININFNNRNKSASVKTKTAGGGITSGASQKSKIDILKLIKEKNQNKDRQDLTHHTVKKMKIKSFKMLGEKRYSDA